MSRIGQDRDVNTHNPDDDDGDGIDHSLTAASVT